MPLGVLEARLWSISAVVCMGRPLQARVLIEILRILMGRPSVARPALFAAVPLRAPYDCKKTPGRVCGHGEITCAELFCGCVCMGRGRFRLVF